MALEMALMALTRRVLAAFDVFPAIVLTLWVGGLWTIGYIVAPILFSSLGDRHLAGEIAGQLFHTIGWVGLVSCACLVFFLFWRCGPVALRTWTFRLLAVMAILTALGLFGIQPLLAELKLRALPLDVMDSVWRDRFVAWHGVSSMFYLVQSLLGAVLVVRVGRGGFK